jgi:hypothetical protein
VLPLASLLWRIRRATGMETDLLRIQAEILRERAESPPQDGEPQPPPNPLYRVLRAVIPPRWTQNYNPTADDTGNEGNGAVTINCLSENTVEPTRILTHCFLRLVNLDNGAFKRLNRYEAALWRQTIQTMVALQSVRYR